MQQFVADGEQLARWCLTHFLDDELGQQGSETLASGGRGNAGLRNDLLVDALVILLVVVQLLLKILGGNHDMVGRNRNRADDIQDVLKQKGCEGDNAINLLPHLILIEPDSYPRGGREIGGEVRVAQSPVSKGPPRAILRRRQLPDRGAVIGILYERDIFQRERSDTPATALQLAVLARKTAGRAQFCPVHRLHEEDTRAVHTKQPASSSEQIMYLRQSGLRLWQRLKQQRKCAAILRTDGQRVQRKQA